MLSLKRKNENKLIAQLNQRNIKHVESKTPKYRKDS